MKANQLKATKEQMEQYNGYALASTWIQCGRSEGVNGPFARLGGLSNLGSNYDEQAAWNKGIDVLHPDAGIRWWMEYVKDNYGPWSPPATKARQRNVSRHVEKGGELSIEAEDYSEHVTST
jgi:hypothetical protein